MSTLATLTADIKMRSAWSIFMGIITAALGGVPDCLPSGHSDDHHAAPGLGIDLRRHRSGCLCAVLADGRKVLEIPSNRF